MRSRPARHPLHGILVGLALAASGAPPSSARSEPYALETHARAGVPVPATEGVRDAASRTHVLLQLTDGADRAALADRGVRFLAYVPRDTWLASVPPGFFDIARPAVRWADHLTPHDRLHPELWSGQLPAAALRPDARAGLYVRFFDDVPRTRARAVLAAMGAEVLTEMQPLPAFEIAMDPAAIERLATTDEVLWIRRRTPPMRLANDGIMEAAHIAPLHAPPYDLDGAGTVIGVWDGGNPNAHVDFASRMTIAQSASPSNHSTHVIGTLAGSGAGSAAAGGTPFQWRGAAFGADLVVYDLDDAANEYAEAIATYGLTLANNSWSLFIDEVIESNCDAYGDYDFLAPEFDAIARTYGDSLVVVFSAGNERDDGDCGLSGSPYVNYGTITPPGTAKNVLCVGATNSNDDSMTAFSGWGPTDDGRVKPDLVAPGCQIGGDLGVISCKNTAEYGRMCGTSMSAPAVTGALALVDEAFRARTGTRPPGALLRAIVLCTARDLGQPGPDYRFGFGALDAQAAVDLVDIDAYALGTVTTGQSNDHVFHVNPGTPAVRVTLVWDDPTAAPQADPTLVNDLDLVLVDPNGIVHDPWVLNPSFPTQDAGHGVNERDVVEQVLVSSPASGAWIARVTGGFVPVGPQSYALAGTTPELPCAGARLDVPSAYASIQSAIDAASPCDTVVVAPGTYSEILTIDEEIVLRSEAGPAFTILQPLFPSRLMHVTASARVEGFTLRGGTALGAGYPVGYGGAVFSQDASPRFVSCRFRDNQATLGGGAVFAFQDAPSFVACDFDSNLAGSFGGAVYLEDTVDAELVDCLLHHNTATTDGGALAISAGRTLLTRCTFADNEAGGSGGAVHTAGTDTVHVGASIFARNSASLEGGIASVSAVSTSCTDRWMNAPADTSLAPGPDDLVADPLFCERVYGDYGIDLASPCHPDSTASGCGRIGARDPEDCSVVAVDAAPAGSPRAAGLRVLGPNPLRGGVRIALDVPSTTFVDAGVYDAGGRRVATLHHGVLAAGRRLLSWDGRDTRGAHVAPGVYFARARIGAAGTSTKLVVLR